MKASSRPSIRAADQARKPCCSPGFPRADTHPTSRCSIWPTVANHYQPLIEHPTVIRVEALSGGYSRDGADTLLTENTGLIASFSRALTEGLSVDQPDDEFDATLDCAIELIYQASTNG